MSTAKACKLWDSSAEVAASQTKGQSQDLAKLTPLGPGLTYKLQPFDS